MGIILGNKHENIPGLVVKCWQDSKYKQQTKDRAKRTRRVRGLVFHTHLGKLGNLIKGFGPDSKIDDNLASYQVNTDRIVSWDGTMDMNGALIWQNDPLEFYTYHGNNTNQFTLGVELVQEPSTGDLYEGQLEKTVTFIDYMTARLGIQRQIPWDKRKDEPILTQLPRLETGEDFVGIYGHVNITKNRGKGDPGPWLFYMLKDAGYELFDVNSEEDKKVWRERQKKLGLKEDGIPLKDTVEALKKTGHNKHGMYITRPMDSLIEPLKG